MTEITDEMRLDAIKIMEKDEVWLAENIEPLLKQIRDKLDAYDSDLKDMMLANIAFGICNLR